MEREKSKHSLAMIGHSVGRLNGKFSYLNEINKFRVIGHHHEQVIHIQRIVIIENVYIDTQRMEQVLTNLISNAIKFSKENGVVEITSSKPFL